ncbi:hypothetical protein D8S78_19735 [Natrialba swarupiae]|nr:hypothetical protein [Natrialba swarupiae]
MGDRKWRIDRRTVLVALSVPSGAVSLAVPTYSRRATDADGEPVSDTDPSRESDSDDPQGGLVDPEVELEVEHGYIPLVTDENADERSELTVSLTSDAELEDLTVDASLEGVFGSATLDDLEETVSIDGKTAELSGAIPTQQFQPGENTVEIELRDDQGIRKQLQKRSKPVERI